MKNGVGRRESNESNRATLMIIMMSLFYLGGNIMDSISGLFPILGYDIYANFQSYLVISNTFLFLEHGMPIFIYYSCNRSYKRIFRRMFKLSPSHDPSDSGLSQTNSMSRVNNFELRRNTIASQF